MALIVIQAGHCFRTSGATGTGGLDGEPTEQEFAWAAANRTAGLLRDAGHQAQVILADVPTGQYQGDAFVAIHCDGSTSPSARGASVGYRTSEGQALAAAWKRHYAAAGWSGFRPDNYTSALAGYYGTRNAVAQGNRTAFIAEAGFLTSPQDEALLSPPGGPERFARALTAAVVEMFGGQIEEEDMPLNADDEALIERAVTRVLDRGTAEGFQGWAPTNQGGIQLLRSIFNRIAQLPDTSADIDEAEVARLVLAGLPAEAIAAAIPASIRQGVADELASRLAD